MSKVEDAPLAGSIDIDSYVPFHINSISNKLTHGASRLYTREFGVGVIEWRILGYLAVHDGASANMICQRLGIDKAAASRSLRLLEEKGLMTTSPVNGRQRALSLTEAGHAMHDRILPVALRRERTLLRELSDDERATLIALLRKVSVGLAELEAEA